MQTIITVAGITPPGVGKKQGHIIDSEGNKWNVWGDKLQNYRMGVTYDIIYEENEFNGKTFNVIKTAVPSNAQPVQPQRQAPQAAPPQVHGFSPKDEMIFVCGALNNAMANPNSDPFRVQTTELITFINLLRTAWRNTLGKPPSQVGVEMDDEIPF